MRGLEPPRGDGLLADQTLLLMTQGHEGQNQPASRLLSDREASWLSDREAGWLNDLQAGLHSDPVHHLHRLMTTRLSTKDMPDIFDYFAPNPFEGVEKQNSHR